MMHTEISEWRHTDELDDFLLPAPDAGTRLSYTLAPADQRRVDLHAALTAAGIPPGAGDASAIDALSLLDTTSVSAVIRWINCGAGMGVGRTEW